MESKPFDIERGTKQGDPLSSLLFNCLSEEIFRECRAKWGKRKYGLRLGFADPERLTNLRFADDVMLIGATLTQLRRTLGDIVEVAKRTGLELHPQKTKILHNVESRRPRKSPEYTKVGDVEVEILPYTGSQKYLGRKFTFSNQAQVEIEARIQAGWNKFWLFKQELLSRCYPIRDRLRLFSGTVTPTILYGCASWTMTVSLEEKLRSAQRRMLRMILGSPRKQLPGPRDGADATTNNNTNIQYGTSSLEPWVAWVRRTTHTAEHIYTKFGYDSWVDMQRRRKVEWVQHVNNRSAGKWSYRSLQWDPDITGSIAKRRPHGPRRRWTDDMKM